MATSAKFRIDVAIHNLLMNSAGGRPFSRDFRNA